MHSHVIAGYSMPKIQAATLVFCICRMPFALFRAAAGDPFRSPYYAKHSRITRPSPRRHLYRLEIFFFLNRIPSDQ